MSLAAQYLRRCVFGVIAVGAVVSSPAPLAFADLPPNCTAADRASIAAGVSAATSVYLFTHPEVNDFMTGLKGQPIGDVRSMVQDYLDANPQTKAEVQAIRQPLTDMRDRCGAGLLDDQPMGDQPMGDQPAAAVS